MDRISFKDSVDNFESEGPGAEPIWRKWTRRQLFSQVPCLLAVLDSDLNIVENNPYFMEIFGEGRGRKCYEVYKGLSAPCEDCAAKKAFSDARTHVNEEAGCDQHGCEAHIIVNHTPVVDYDGSVSYVVQMGADVTEIKARQREYKTLFDSVPCLIYVVNRDMRIVRTNDNFRENFGEINGQRCYEKLAGRAEPCDECPVAGTFQDGGFHRARQVFHTKLKPEASYLVTSSPISRDNPDSPYATVMALDVTENEELREDLAESNLFREVMIEDSIDAIFGTDADGKISLVNPAGEALLGYSAKELIGNPPPEGLFPKEFMDVINKREKKCILPETTLRNKQGDDIPARFIGVAVSRGKRLMGYAAFTQDLRPIKNLEREKIEVERLAAVGQAAAGVAHTIKNILNGLEGGMYVFQSGMSKNDNERLEKGWEMLERNIGRVTTLTRHLLDFTKEREPQYRLIDPLNIVREVIELYRESAWEAEIELQENLPERVEPASMDPEGLHSCLSNLVSNALDACRASVKPLCRVKVSCREEGENLIFEIEDEGCGMDYEARRQAFSKMFTTKQDSGTGLGLFFTRKIVKEHGGRIDLESEPEKGARFTLIFPRSALPEPNQPSDSDSRGENDQSPKASPDADGSYRSP